MLFRASAAVHLCLEIVGCGSESWRPLNHAPSLGGAKRLRGVFARFRADMRQCMIHLSQLN